MRDAIVLAIIFVSAPVGFIHPYFGILVWTWVSYFNPHRYAYGIAHDFPVALVMAVPTLLGTVFTRQRNRVFLVRETVILGLLWLWFCFTTVYIRYVPAFAGHTEDATFQLKEISKILLMTLLTILVVNSREKLRNLLLVIAASFGVRTIAGAIFTVRTGGQFRIWGPDSSFIADNNDFALALNMTLPLLFCLLQDENKYLRLLLRLMIVSCIVCIIMSYSRGGFLGLVVVLTALLAKSRKKLPGLVLITVGSLILLTFGPPEWKDRITRFLHGEVDQSANSRLVTWQAGWRLARDYPITGAGFAAFPDANLLVKYIPGATLATDFKGAHSIYFQMLGEQGFVGLGLFFALLVTSYATARRVRKRALRSPQLKWMASYSQGLQVSLLAYAVSGATLGRAYFDLMYQIIACIVVLKILSARYSSMGVEQPALVAARIPEPEEVPESVPSELFPSKRPSLMLGSLINHV